MIRPDWETYWFQIAATVATRATCPRASIGAVLVKDKKILSTGYNGPASGRPHCPLTTEHLNLAHCLESLHAERNALANATVQMYGATMFVVGPRVVCPDCRDAMTLCGVEYRYRPMVPTLESVLADVTAWQRENFKQVTIFSITEHLRREAEELSADPTSESETADVLILLNAVAAMQGVNLADAVSRKMRVNRARSWAPADHMGVVEHVRIAPAPPAAARSVGGAP